MLKPLLDGTRLMHFEDKDIVQAIAESFPGYIYICSRDHRLQYMNRRLTERLGRDATGEPCYSALHGIENKCRWCMADRVLLGETVESEVTSPLDGRTYSMTGTPLRDSAGAMAMLSLLIDMSQYRDGIMDDLELDPGKQHHERIQLEMQIEEKTAGLTQVIQWLDENIRQKEAVSNRLEIMSSVLDASHTVFVIINAGGTIEYVNDQYSRMSGFVKADMAGHVLTDCLKTGMGELQSVREELVREKKWAGRLEFRKKDGSDFALDALVSTVTISNRNGPETYYIIASSETEKK